MTDGLSQLRLLFASYCSALVGVGVVVGVLVTSADWGDGDDIGALVGAAQTLLVCVLALVARQLVHRRRLDGSSAASMVASFRTRWLLELACGDLPVLVGFTAFVLVHRPEPFLVGFVISAVAFWLLAPTDRHLQAVDEELAQQGCPLRLTDALRSMRSGSRSGSREIGR